MKKILALLLVTLLVGSLVGCKGGNDVKNTSEEATEATQETTTAAEDIIDIDFTDVESSDEDPGALISGGFEIYIDETMPNMTEEQKKVCEKAFDSFTGYTYTPIAVIGTQVVAGLNYSVLCRGTSATQDPVTGYFIVTIYEDLQGNATISYINPLELDASLEFDDETEESSAAEQETDASGMLCGGWTINSELGVLDMPLDFQSPFDKAMEKLSEANISVYYPNWCLGTQMVAGTNFAILATQMLDDGTAVVGVLYVYEDLTGDAIINKFQPIDPADYNCTQE